MFEKSKFKSEQLNNQLVLTYDDKDVFRKGTDVNLDILKKVEEYRNQYIENAIETAATLSKKELKSNSKLEKIVVQFPYTTSARGNIEVVVDRSKTFKGINGKDSVTKSKITTIVTDPINKASKKKIHNLEAELTKTLLG